MRRKRMRRYRPGIQNSGVKFTGFIVIIIATVICGYLTARFLVGPLLGYDTEVLKLDFPSDLTGLTEENREAEKNETTQKQDNKPGYHLQFGVFSTKGGAKELKAQLEKEGIETIIKENKKQYKVVSETFSSKEKALERLEALKEKKNIDVFIDTVD